MKYRDIRRHLKPYSIVANRTTTINHAFAAAVAPADSFDDQRVRESIEELDQDPEKDLRCVYCGALAETWDHVFATVVKAEFSGHGHRLGNLVPACKPCNSRKGNKTWTTYLDSVDEASGEISIRKQRLQRYLSRYKVVDVIQRDTPEYKRLQEIRNQVLQLFAEADGLASQIRIAEARESQDPPPSSNRDGNCAVS